jgi:hypothetical protein
MCRNNFELKKVGGRWNKRDGRWNKVDGWWKKTWWKLKKTWWIMEQSWWMMEKKLMDDGKWRDGGKVMDDGWWMMEHKLVTPALGHLWSVPDPIRQEAFRFAGAFRAGLPEL